MSLVMVIHLYYRAENDSISRFQTFTSWTYVASIVQEVASLYADTCITNHDRCGNAHIPPTDNPILSHPQLLWMLHDALPIHATYTGIS